MAIEIIRNGMVIRVSNAEELRLVLSALDTTGGRVPRKAESTGKLGHAKPSPSSPITLLQFFHALDNTKVYYGMLLALEMTPEGMSDEELQKKLKIEQGQKLGGSIGGLSKRAERRGLKLSDMVTITEDTKNGVTKRHYALTDKMREVMGAK